MNILELAELKAQNYESPRVLYYPLGTTIVDGEEIDNHEIARRFLESYKYREGVILPRGWRLAKL